MLKSAAAVLLSGVLLSAVPAGAAEVVKSYSFTVPVEGYPEKGSMEEQNAAFRRAEQIAAAQTEDRKRAFCAASLASDCELVMSIHLARTIPDAALVVHATFVARDAGSDL